MHEHMMWHTRILGCQMQLHRYLYILHARGPAASWPHVVGTDAEEGKASWGPGGDTVGAAVGAVRVAMADCSSTVAAAETPRGRKTVGALDDGLRRKAWRNLGVRGGAALRQQQPGGRAVDHGLIRQCVM